MVRERAGSVERGQVDSGSSLWILERTRSLERQVLPRGKIKIKNKNVKISNQFCIGMLIFFVLVFVQQLFLRKSVKREEKVISSKEKQNDCTAQKNTRKGTGSILKKFSSAGATHKIFVKISTPRYAPLTNIFCTVSQLQFFFISVLRGNKARQK